MQRSGTDRSNRHIGPDDDLGPTGLDREPEQFAHLTGVVRLAVGRLGAEVSPWLDEGLLMSQGLLTLLELEGDLDGQPLPQHLALDRVTCGMRAWARGSSWYRAAWPCRVAPLCSSLAERGPGDGADRQIARDLGLDRQQLAERYGEAGLVFGVSPELLLPRHALGPGSDGLSGAVAELPLEQRRLLTLYFEDGLSFPEIAELLEAAPGDVQARYGRAAARIRARVFGTRQLAEVSTRS